jgi:hypothetical protein
MTGSTVGEERTLHEGEGCPMHTPNPRAQAAGATSTWTRSDDKKQLSSEQCVLVVTVRVRQ